MKKLKLIPIAIATLSITLFSSCKSTTKEDMKDAKEELVEAENNLEETKEAYYEDIEAYKKDMASKIAENQKIVTDFNDRIDAKKEEATADYKEKIAQLDEKNSDMQKKMDEYKSDGKDNWENFKTEFSHDMDELVNALKDLTVKNVD